MRPIVINSDGYFQLAHGAIRVGEATQPYHAVPLSQVKKLLSLITVAVGVFRVRSEFTVSDKAIGFCLSEPGIYETLDSIYTGKIVEETRLITDSALVPLTLQPVRETVSVIEVFNPYVLSDPGADVGEIFDTVSTGKFIDEVDWDEIIKIAKATKVTEPVVVDEHSASHILGEKGWTDGNVGYVYTGATDDAVSIKDKFVTAKTVTAVENILAADASLSHILGEVGWSDGTIGYVYSGSHTDAITIEEVFIAAAKTVVAETITTDDVNKSDLVSISLPKEADAYPDEGIVVQKTRPSSMKETKKVGDAVIIKKKYKVTDKCAFKDKAFGFCLSDAFVAEPLTTLAHAVVREAVTVDATPVNSKLESV